MSDPAATGPSAVLAALPARTGAAPGGADWPGVADPDELRGLVARWLAGYGSAQTRRTYAYALGLPPEWADAVTGAAPDPRPGPGHTGTGHPPGPDHPGTGYPPGTGHPGSGHPPGHGRSGTGRPAPDDDPPGRARPPAAPRGPLHHLAWFRWCATRGLDPRAATGAHVTTWLHALDAAGARPRTRARMLSTVAALYADLVEQGVLAGNPAALNRSRLGLGGTAREPSPTVRLTAGQVRALLESAARLPDRTRHAELTRRRAVVVVALLSLGLRVSELAALDRDDVVLTGGHRVLRVLGKGGHRREVYLPGAAAAAVDEYLAARDRASGDALPARRGRTGPGSPLVVGRDGGRCTRFGLYALLRRVAEHAGPELDGVAGRVHPHALRHAYVTIALENDARIQHVQADVGHASVATTQHYDRGLRRREASAADLVSEAITGAGSGHTPTPEDR